MNNNGLQEYTNFNDGKLGRHCTRRLGVIEIPLIRLKQAAVGIACIAGIESVYASLLCTYSTPLNRKSLRLKLSIDQKSVGRSLEINVEVH